MQIAGSKKSLCAFIVLGVFLAGACGTMQATFGFSSAKNVDVSDNKIEFGLGKKSLIASLLLVALPMWQCYRKSSRVVIPEEEEYSIDRMKDSFKILWRHYIVQNTVGWFRKGEDYTVDQVNDAAGELLENLKKLYHLGYIGQRKRKPSIKIYKGMFSEGDKAPVRGICGHAIDMMGDLEDVAKQLAVIAGTSAFIYKLMCDKEFLTKIGLPKIRIAGQ